MSTTMVFPRTKSLQAASIYTQQATVQQTGGIDIYALLMNLLPIVVIGMMAKMMTSMPSKKKQVKVTETKNTNTQTKK